MGDLEVKPHKFMGVMYVRIQKNVNGFEIAILKFWVTFNVIVLHRRIVDDSKMGRRRCRRLYLFRRGRSNSPPLMMMMMMMMMR